MEAFFIELLQTHGIAVFFGAFSIGALTSLAPCSIITVPLLVGSALSLSGHLSPKERVRFTYIFAFLFAFGVALSFSIMAFLVAKMGFFFSIAPFEAYSIAGVMALLIGLYALEVFPSVIDKNAWMIYLVKLRFLGVFLIGMLFGLVSTPCASAPLVAIIGVASTAPTWYAYALVLTFALGHALLLLIAGVSVGFTQAVITNAHLNRLSTYLTRLFAWGLFAIAGYFFYAAWIQF